MNKVYASKCEYNCTLSYLAHKIGIKLWQAMEVAKWARENDKPKEKIE